MNEFLILLQGKLDEAKSKGLINSDIASLQGQLDKLKLQVEIDPKSAQKLANDIGKLLNQQITISNINIDTNQAVRNAQQTGQQIGDAVNKGVENSVKKATNALKSFSELKIGTGNIDAIVDKNGLLDVEKSLDRIKEKYSKFGQVKITDKLFDSEGNLQQFRVNIQQLNGDLKESRSFMMALASSGKSFGFPENVIKGSESYVHHLNDAKKSTNEVLTEEEKLANIMADVREKTEQTRQAEEKRQQLAQSNAINKSLEQEYLQRQKISEQLSSKANKIQLLSNGGIKNDYSTQISKLEGNFRALGLTQDQITEKMKNVTSSFDVLKAKINQPFDESNYQEIIALNNKLQTELAETENEYTRLHATAKGYVSMQQRLSKANEIEAWNQKNTAATIEVRSANDAYIASLRDLNSQMTKMQFNKIVNGFKESENSMRLLGKLGLSLRNQMTQAMSSFSTWLSASTLVMTLISKTRNAVSELKNVNTLLTEISKTNHSLTPTDLGEIGDRGFNIASKYGKAVTDYLTGVQDMSRAGYQNSEAMAEVSTAAQGAGDMTAEIANKMVIATDKAYKLGGSVEELTRILDGVNWICDNNAVNMSELSEGMSIVGSTAASLGVDVDELTATLGTMAASTQQSGSEVARAFKAILLNIRQVSDEEEGIDTEGLTKYEKACNALGVSLKETKNGVLQTRDAMEVLKELSEEYNKLDENDIRRTDLLNSVGGKLRSTQLDALLRQWDMYENMLNQFSEGSGTMAAEAEKTANSWEGSLKRLHNTWVDTVGNIVNSDFVITITNGFNGLLSVINNVTSKLGSLGTIGLGAGIFAGVKNIGKTVQVYRFQIMFLF